MADARTEEAGREQARTGEEPLSGEPRRLPRRRRPIVIILAILAGIVVYGLAFQQTEVDLEEITSETRQESLTRILRALAQPNLVTYDTDRNEVATEIAVPCGPDVAPGSDRLLIDPTCAAPGETVTVTGTGFASGRDVEIEFVPDSEFAITLPLEEVRTDGEGRFSAEVVIPERESDQPQQVIAVTEEPIGSWGDRVEIYTDANENETQEDPILAEGGTRQVVIDAQPEVPAVALVDPSRDVVQFFSTGEAFEAVGGLADADTAVPVDEDARDTGVRVTEVSTADGGTEITVTGPPGSDLSNWRVALYDAATGENVGLNFITDTFQLSPRISDTAMNSLDKIFETVFLALVATTAGVILAVPFSFIAARNLMRDISVTVTNLALILLAIPAGAFVGAWASNGASLIVDPLAGSVWGSLLGAVVAAAVALVLARAAFPPAELEAPSRADRVRRGLLFAAAAAGGLVALLFTAVLFQQIGEGLTSVLGRLGFIGAFFSSIGEILEVAMTVIAALAAAGFAASLATKLGYSVRSRTPRPLLLTLNFVLLAAAGAVWAVLIAQVIDWLYLINNTTYTITVPALVGGVLGLLVAFRAVGRGEVPIGLSVYYASRTVFNTLRSIEPLVMAIVFVVWVGLGPFAGSLALALHTTAALAKLYSEQVESILPGPMEAVRATGANRLQTIVYAVVPQIVPPYISFTMYRWDINVRMSTILGFVGGGGIGSILQQNINLVQYRDAAVQMLAIAIVVATMDYVSSRLRERFV